MKKQVFIATSSFSELKNLKKIQKLKNLDFY